MDTINSKIPYKIYAEKVEDEALRQFEACLRMEGCVQGALMADTHTGYVAPIGSVLKFENQISPALVGYDIGCGVISAELDIKPGDLDLEKLKNSILRSVPIGFNRHNKAKIYNFDKSKASPELLVAMSGTGVYQLGTLGGGNHFIELGENEENGNVHIIIHSGSRGFGHKVATHYMKEAAVQSIDEQRYKDEFDAQEKNIEWKAFLDNAKPSPKKDNQEKAYFGARDKFVYRRTRARLKTKIEGNYSLSLDTDVGKQYMIDQNIALDFALANRKAMVNAIIKDINFQLDKPVEVIQIINRNHNHAELQTIKHSNSDGSFTDEQYIIHRKGATHAEEGMFGVIPGNMKDGCFVVQGLGNPDSMSSSSHGAGRVLSRKKAKEQLSLNKFHKEMDGIVTNHKDNTLDEAPDAYKNIFEVMDAQKELVKVIAHVKPILNIKG